MKKTGLITGGVITGIVLSFLLSLLNKDSFTVVAANETESKILLFSIEIDDKVYSIKNIEKKTDKILNIPLSSENSYLVKVKFENGNEISGEGGYVEPGYIFYEFIRASEIEHRLRSL